MISVLTVIGTRPEAIKLAPVLKELEKSNEFESQVCVTRQHTDLLDPLLTRLAIQADYTFVGSKHHGNLHHNAAEMLAQFGTLLQETKPELMIVQGDTTSAFVAALSAYYAHIPVAHIEAGLRTGDLYSPWPEEGHRQLIDRLATYSFAPTEQAKKALLAEGIPAQNIWVVGNTSIDVLRLVNAQIPGPPVSNEKYIVVTAHRRENQGEPLRQICQAVRNLADLYSGIRVQFVLHPNPSVRQPVLEMLTGIERVELLDPLDHHNFIAVLKQATFVITDSGGIQEEASFLGKPVLVIRDTTERPEVIEAGTAQLIGTQSDNILNACRPLLDHPEKLNTMSQIHYPYGDGFAAQRIVAILQSAFTGVCP